MARISTRKHHFRTGVFLATALVFPMASSAHAGISGPLAKTVAKGQQIFLHDTFGGSGTTCNTCHTGAGLGPTVVPGSPEKGPSLANAAAVFPRYKPREGKVMTLQDEIYGCARGAIGGTPPPYNSDTMRALVSYLTSLSQGKRVKMGGAYK
jgi:thiosulfate dehydrogenase